jgi:hypothetical protein
MRTFATTIIVATLVGAQALASQSIARPTIASGRLWNQSRPYPIEGDQDRGGILGDGSRDHRYAGFWTGLAVGTGLTLLGAAYCSDSDTGCRPGQPWKGAIIAIPVLAGTGALIGTMFPKHPSD